MMPVEAEGSRDAATGLAQALRLDRSLAEDPARLRRALMDLAPFDERGGWLLTLGAAVDAPSLISQGLAAEAHARLADLCGCRRDAADWAVAAWAAALGRDLPAGFASDDTDPGVGHDAAGTDDADLDDAGQGCQVAEEPGPPTALRIAVWPDGGPALAAVTMRGAFILDGVRVPARGRWRQAATMRTPLSRDVALAIGPVSAQVAWSDHGGVYARSVRKNRSGPPGLGNVRLAARPPDGEQARYPLAVLASGWGISVLWTADRRAVRCAEVSEQEIRAGGNPVPLACADGERLTCLDICAETERTAWLACLTDQGRLQVARWDLTLGQWGAWLPLSPPAVPVTAAVACLSGVPVVIVATAAGDLLSTDARTAVEGSQTWHSIDRPAQIREARPVRVLAAGNAPGAFPGEAAWLALSGGDGVWAVPAAWNGQYVACGEPFFVWTGE